METKIIPGFSRYSITSNGQVINIRLGHHLKSYDNNGYRCIGLTNDQGKRVQVGLHRLVASAWIGPIPKGYWINHKNGNKADNRLSNLEIDTPSHNLKHKHRVLGIKNGSYNPERRELIALLVKLGWSQHRIARALNCSQSNVSTMLTHVTIV